MKPSALIVLSWFAIGCAASHEPARYSGRTEPRIIEVAAVGEEPALPSGYERLGTVEARCRLVKPAPELRQEWLSDVDCTPERLTRALREAAAEAGGELLIARTCRTAPDRETIRCSAGVARPNAHTLAARPLAANAGTTEREPGVPKAYADELDEPSGTEAWRIRIDYQPTAHGALRAPRTTEQIRELPVLPVSHERLGDVVASCDGTCSESALRGGLRATAARIGATEIVTVRCFAAADGNKCTATAAVPECHEARCQ